jgi:hypothetical protein
MIGKHPAFMTFPELQKWSRSQPDKPDDLGIVYHITPPGNKESIIRNGLSEGSYVSTRYWQSLSMYVSIMRMISFYSDEEVVYWAESRGATKKQIDDGLRHRNKVPADHPDIELYNTPAFLYLCILWETDCFESDIVPYWQQLWHTPAFNFIGKGGVVQLKGRFKYPVEKEDQRLWSPRNISNEGGFVMESGITLVDWEQVYPDRRNVMMLMDIG